MKETPNRIPLENCKHGYVYKLYSRNLDYGVFVKEEQGFIGIREKFGHLYLFTEYHWDQGPPYGTANPLEELTQVPEHLQLKEYLGSKDSITGREVAFDKPGSQGGKGWYFVDTGEPSQEIRSQSISNDELFKYLETFSAKC